MSDTLQKALEFAVTKEKEAEAFYKEWAEKAADATVKALFAEMAATEHGHMEMLLRVTPADMVGGEEARVEDLNLSDVIAEVEAAPNLNLQQAMIVAMKREEAAAALYERLAAVGGETKSLFEALANEERKHKLQIETEYDEHILTEN